MLKNKFLTSSTKKVSVSVEKVTTLITTRVKNNKVLRALELDQSKLLKKFIEFNTQKRIEADYKFT